MSSIKKKNFEKRGVEITGLYCVKIDTQRMEVEVSDGCFTIYLPFRGWIHMDDYPKRFHPSHYNFLEKETHRGLNCLCDVSKFLQELNFKYCCT